MSYHSVVYAASGLVLLVAFIRYLSAPKKTNLPPGPKGLPFLGNVKDLPPAGVPEYSHWLKHKDLYGPISSISMLGQTLVVLHDKKVAAEILEKKSSKSSDRPTTEMNHLLNQQANIVPNLPLNDNIRYCRKLFHQQMGTGKLVERFQSTLDLESRRFMLNILKTPDDILKHMHTLAGATILKATYGYSPETNGNDPLVNRIENFIALLMDTVTPGRWMVDLFPMIKHWPKGLPGTEYARAVRGVANEWKDLERIPYTFVRSQMENGTHAPSFVSNALEERLVEKKSKLTPADEEAALKSTAAIMYIAAEETTTTSLRAIILAMIRYPEVQRKAHEELDRVIGHDRLPGYEDQKSLPYIEALITEVMRWWPAVPMGVPHMVAEDMTAGGYLIPKGAAILPSVWWFCHDPETHPDPERFDPERFLAPRNEADPREIVFGYGRRICPGRHFADTTLWINVARLLAAFEMSKAVDANGNEIDPNPSGSAGLSLRIESFPFKITPRNKQRAELVERVCATEAVVGQSHMLNP